MSTDLTTLQDTLSVIRKEVGKVIIGQEEAIRFSLIAILTGQHVLVEGVPGLEILDNF